MASPAVPAMPTTAYSSAAKTFSMSRLAMRLPIVERRSPAMMTPPANSSATIVVPCGASRLAPGGNGRRAGSSSGATCPTNSLNDAEPGTVNAWGNRPERPAEDTSELTGRPSARTRARTPRRWLRGHRRSRRARCRCRRRGLQAPARAPLHAAAGGCAPALPCPNLTRCRVELTQQGDHVRATVEDRPHVRLGPALRLEHRHPLEGLPPRHVEDHRVP